MGTYVLLHLLKELGKRDKLQGFMNSLSLNFNELMNSIIPKQD